MEDEAGEQESGVYDTLGGAAGDRELVSWIKNSGKGEHRNLGLHQLVHDGAGLEVDIQSPDNLFHERLSLK
jgi:hypothetical protein